MAVAKKLKFSKNNYSIVAFTEEDGYISLVPSSWLCDSKTNCRWPPKVAGPSIQHLKQPKDNWATVPVCIIEEGIETYAQGKLHEKRAEDNKHLTTTDAETPTTISRSRTKSLRKSKEKKKLPTLTSVISYEGDASSSNTSSILDNYQPLESDDEELFQRLDALKNSTVVLEPPPVNVEDDAGVQAPEIITEGFIISQTEIQSICVRLDNLERRQEGLENVIATATAEIKSDLRELVALMKLNNTGKQVDALAKIPFQFPISTAEGLTELESWLEKEGNVTILAQYCSTFGGNAVGKIVREILRRILSANLTKKINYVGANGKIEFRKLHLRKVVIDATRRNDGKEHTTDEKIVPVIKSWFQNSRDLEGGRGERKTKKDVVISDQKAKDST